MSNANRFDRIVGPVTDLVILNAETTGAILQRQNAFVADLISASVDQVKVLAEAGSVRDALDAQRAYLQEVGEKFQTTARDNVETIRGAGRHAGTVVRGVFDRTRGEIEEAVDTARTEAAVAVEEAAEAVTSSIAPAVDAPQQF